MTKNTKNSFRVRKLQLSKKTIARLTAGAGAGFKTTEGPTCTISFNGPLCRGGF